MYKIFQKLTYKLICLQLFKIMLSLQISRIILDFCIFYFYVIDHLLIHFQKD